MSDLNLSDIATIILNVNGLNTPNKRQRMSKCIKKQAPTICCLQETHFKYKDTNRLKAEGWKKIYHNTIQSWNGYFNQNKLHSKEYYEIIFFIPGNDKRVNLWRDVTILKSYASNNSLKIHEAKSYRTAREIDKSVSIAEDVNTPLSIVLDKSSGLKIIKNIEDLNNIINQLGLTDIYI